MQVNFEWPKFPKQQPAIAHQTIYLFASTLSTLSTCISEEPSVLWVAQPEHSVRREKFYFKWCSSHHFWFGHSSISLSCYFDVTTTTTLLWSLSSLSFHLKRKKNKKILLHTENKTKLWISIEIKLWNNQLIMSDLVHIRLECMAGHKRTSIAIGNSNDRIICLQSKNLRSHRTWVRSIALQQTNHRKRIRWIDRAQEFVHSFL